MNNNEKQYLECALNLKAKIFDAQKYIHENYNVKTNYDEDTNTLHIFTDNINESLNCAAAKEYLKEINLDNFIKVQYGI